MLSCFSHVWLFATPWTVAHQSSLSMGFPRQEYWSGLQFPSSRGSSPPRDQTWVFYVSWIGRWILDLLGSPVLGCSNEACRILVPWPETIHWKHGVLTTGPPGNFQLYSKHLLCPSVRFYHWHLMIAPLRYNAYTIHLTYWKLDNLTLNKDLFF